MHTRTRRTLPGLATALISAALVLTTAPAQAARMPLSSSTDTPVNTTTGAPIVVTTNGYGHGHGMSQWGAKGAADAGLSTQQILSFYYPGTSLGGLPPSTGIKVLITADTDNNLTVYPARGLRVRDLGNGRTYKLRHTKRTPRLWRLVQKNGHTKVFYRTSRWHLYKTAGRRSLAGDGEFRAPGGTTLKLRTGPKKYRGALRFTNRDTVNVLNLEKYVRGVIAAESPASWPAAALGAQAVAARTYAVRERADNAGGYYDICDTAACQVYGGVGMEKDTTNAAAAATAGQVLMAPDGTYAFAQFASSNGGWSSAGSQPYLIAQADPYDLAAAPYHHRQKQVDPSKLQAAYPQIGTLTSVQIMKRENSTTPAEWGGWVQTVRLAGTNGVTPTAVDISGDDFRRVYGLRSAYFTFALPFDPSSTP
ncbi:MAG TPA: SpoIID/LytB domain-containing protein [Marmoricola sp.]|nr:SpoIID/LytB domain-containing protein [Marmoricola sp.]